MRGDVRAAVLALLTEGPRHGYAMMSEITERSGGLWRPSPGSVYPILQQLQDEGLVSVEESDGRRVFSLTEAGRGHVEEHRERIGRPWEMADSRSGRRVRTLVESMDALAVAVHQAVRLADDVQVMRAVAVLDDARRALYRVLAGDDVPSGLGQPGPEPGFDAVRPPAEGADSPGRPGRAPEAPETRPGAGT